MNRQDKHKRYDVLLWLCAAIFAGACSRSLAQSQPASQPAIPSSSAEADTQPTEPKEETEEEAKEEAAAALEVEKETPASLPASALETEEITEEDMQYLVARNLLIPVEGIQPSQLRDTYTAPRSGGRKHNANDIMAPRNTPVLATASGTIHKLHTSKNGGISIYQKDANGPYIYYYAHLTRYAENLKEGQKVERGQVIGYVGTTGNARGRHPHLHFGITKVLDMRMWYRGTPINPYPLLTKKALQENNEGKEEKK